MDESTACWYVAYGSNMDPVALGRYLPPESGELRNRHLTLHREVYFAGRSKTWGAAVAFLTLHATYRTVPARAFLLDLGALAQIVRGENGLDFSAQQCAAAAVQLHVGEHVRLPFEQDAEGYRGKYDALLRLDDVEGLPAYAVTTARDLPRGQPAPAYFELIQRARSAA